MLKWLSLSAVAVALSVSAAQAADVGFSIVESNGPGGAEACSATWSSDPSAVFNVTRDDSQQGEVWLIDLSQSGHQAPGAPWPFGFTLATWVEPEHPGTYNNLHIVDPLHMVLESEWPTATGENLADYPGGFGNGVSYYAGNDFNGDQVFVSITEQDATPTNNVTWGNIKSHYR
jgi:hypothetical protein